MAITEFPIFTIKFEDLELITDAQSTDSDGVMLYDDSVGVMKRMTKGELFKGKVIPIDDITGFLGIDYLQVSDRQQYHLNSFAPGGESGGGSLMWSSTLPKILHDGVRYFSPTVPMPADFDNEQDVQDYKDGVGEEFPADLGIFVLTSFSIQSSEFPAVDNAIVLFDGVSGNRVKNGPLVSNFIFGPEISEIGALATYDNTTGTLLANGPTPSAVGVNLIEFPDSAADGYFRKKNDNTLELLTGDQLKTNLSLNNVDNTSDANKPISTATQSALDLKAPLLSPELTGTPTAPTAAADTNTTQIATTAFVQGELTDRVQSVATIADLQALTEANVGGEYSVKEWSAGLGWGGGRFRAISGTVSADNVLTFSSATAGIYFERIDVAVVDCDMAGIAGDGVTDDTVRLQAAITAGAGRRVYLNRHCRLTTVGLQIPSNTIMEFGPNGFLELLPHNSSDYAILSARDVENVTLINPNVDGRRDLNAATTGEWGMGISIRGVSGKALVINPVANNCWGDGYYIGATPNLGWCDDVEIINPRGDNNRRQGLSLISARRFVLEGGELGNTNGTLPAAGVDIEPNGPTDRLDYVRINDLVTYSNQFVGASGILVYLSTLGTAEGRTIDIEVNNHTDKNSVSAITVIGTTPLLRGRVQFNDCTSIGARLIAMGAVETAATGPRVEFKNPTIIDSNRNESSSVDNSAPLNIRRAASAGSTFPIGNAHFVNPTVILNSGSTASLFHARDLKVVGVPVNCSLVDPVIAGTLAARTLTISPGSDVWITDKHDQVYTNFSSSFTPAVDSLGAKRYRHTRSSGNSTITLSPDSVAGEYSIVFENTSGGSFTLAPPPGGSFVGHSADIAAHSGTGRGHKIEVERLTSTLYRIKDAQGTFTYS